MKKLKYFRNPSLGQSWHVDETYIKVKGKWMYLYRAVTKDGRTVDFYLSRTRAMKSAKKFLSKALRNLKDWEKPKRLSTDKAPTYAIALRQLKKEGICPHDLQHRQEKYLNNKIEADHGKLNRLIKPTLGFKALKTAYATIKGFELMHMFKKKQMTMWYHAQGVQGEVRLIERAFGIYTT